MAKKGNIYYINIIIYHNKFWIDLNQESNQK